MKRLLFLALFVVGCQSASGVDGAGNGNVVTRFHDDTESVTCWIANNASIYCIPDHELRP